MFSNQKIIIVEDNEGDSYVMKKIISEGSEGRNIMHFDNGDDAYDYFTALKDKTDEDGLSKVLVILDLNLPGVNGFEILKEIKNKASSKKIPVVIFSNSDYAKDVDLSYELGANCYIQKPHGAKEFKDAIQMIREYWFSGSLLPAV